MGFGVWGLGFGVRDLGRWLVLGVGGDPRGRRLLLGARHVFDHPCQGNSPTVRTFFFFFFTLVTGPRRSLSLKLRGTRVYEPQIRAHLESERSTRTGLTDYSKVDKSESVVHIRQLWRGSLPSKSAAHRDKSREWNVSKQKWNLC